MPKYLKNFYQDSKMIEVLKTKDLVKGSHFKGYTFYKITNYLENHHGFQYQDGLNILKERFAVCGSCVRGGFYFTTFENLHYFYDYGVWIREITIPDDAMVIQDPIKGKWRSDKVILGQRYPLFNIKTINGFNLMINQNYLYNLKLPKTHAQIKDVDFKGRVALSNWLLKIDFSLNLGFLNQIHICDFLERTAQVCNY